MSITFAKKESIPRVETSRKRATRGNNSAIKMRPDSGVTFPSRNSKYSIIAPANQASSKNIGPHVITYNDPSYPQYSNRMSNMNLPPEMLQFQNSFGDYNQRFSSIQQIAADTGIKGSSYFH